MNLKVKDIILKMFSESDASSKKSSIWREIEVEDIETLYMKNYYSKTVS